MISVLKEYIQKSVFLAFLFLKLFHGILSFQATYKSIIFPHTKKTEMVLSISHPLNYHSCGSMNIIM